jgi:ABC-2 type transport system ATP-binding protein
MSEKILEVENLKKYYAEVKAVDGVSFWIKKGEVYSILGPNGAGKTTTIEIIEGLRVKDSGTIRIFGETVESIDRQQKERIGVQLQETNFLPHLKVDETVELFRSFFARSLPTEKVLDISMLEEKRKSYVENLSGGQKQRLALGLALVNDPEIVFLDEPTTGLDPQARRSTWEVIKGLKKEGKTVILTTHYMEEAEELSDYILIMDHGKIIKEGTSIGLVSGLEMQSVVEFEVSGEHAAELLQQPKLEAKPIENGRFSVETPNFMRTLTVLSKLADENGLQLKNVVVRQPNLEDVFLHLTGRTLRE